MKKKPNKETKEAIEELKAGRSLTDFVLSASQEAANKIIQEREVIALTARESEKFINALLNPPAPNLVLREAAKRWKALYIKLNTN